MSDAPGDEGRGFGGDGPELCGSTHVTQQEVGNEWNRPDLQSANPLLAGSSRSRSLDPMGH